MCVFEKIECDVNPFEILKNEVKEFLEEYGIRMYRKANLGRNLFVSHYMTQ
jgi:hypothetical protein